MAMKSVWSRSRRGNLWRRVENLLLIVVRENGLYYVMRDGKFIGHEFASETEAALFAQLLIPRGQPDSDRPPTTLEERPHHEPISTQPQTPGPLYLGDAEERTRQRLKWSPEREQIRQLKASKINTL